MKKLRDLANKMSILKENGDPNRLTQFFGELEEEILPESFLLDKARAIQLSDSDEYELSDAENTLIDVLEISPDYSVAYVELGNFYYAVMDEPEMALDVFQRGIEVAESILRDLNLGRAKALLDIGAYKEASEIVEKFVGIDQRFELLSEDIKEGDKSKK